MYMRGLFCWSLPELYNKDDTAGYFLRGLDWRMDLRRSLVISVISPDTLGYFNCQTHSGRKKRPGRIFECTIPSTAGINSYLPDEFSV